MILTRRGPGSRDNAGLRPHELLNGDFSSCSLLVGEGALIEVYDAGMSWLPQDVVRSRRGVAAIELDRERRQLGYATSCPESEP